MARTLNQVLLSCGKAKPAVQVTEERRVREGLCGRKGGSGCRDGSRLGLPVRNGKAVQPGQLDLYLSADRAEAGPRSIVALDAHFQGSGLKVHHREMLVNLHN